jgi:hypothetical protein
LLKLNTRFSATRRVQNFVPFPHALSLEEFEPDHESLKSWSSCRQTRTKKGKSELERAIDRAREKGSLIQSSMSQRSSRCRARLRAGHANIEINGRERICFKNTLFTRNRESRARISPVSSLHMTACYSALNTLRDKTPPLCASAQFFLC